MVQCGGVALIMHNSSPKPLFELFSNSEGLASHIACTAHVRNPLTQTHIFYIMILQIMAWQTNIWHFIERVSI